MVRPLDLGPGVTANEYGLSRLIADAARDNEGSLKVLRRTGFRPVGEVTSAGRPSIRHVLDLRPFEAL